MAPKTPTAGQPPARRITSSELMERYGDRWDIRRDLSIGAITAEHRSPDGRSIRFVVGRSVPELAGKLAAAEVAEP